MTSSMLNLTTAKSTVNACKQSQNMLRQVAIKENSNSSEAKLETTPRKVFSNCLHLPLTPANLPILSKREEEEAKTFLDQLKVLKEKTERKVKSKRFTHSIILCSTSLTSITI